MKKGNKYAPKVGKMKSMWKMWKIAEIKVQKNPKINMNKYRNKKKNK